jgi:hypothetical protein
MQEDGGSQDFGESGEEEDWASSEEEEVMELVDKQK